MSYPKVTVVVLTSNAGPGFEDLLERLGEQETSFPYEVVVIDSGSTDGTVALALRHGARVHRIPRREFDHGGTRNLGLSLSGAEYLAFVVQDALPLGRRWLAAMVENLDADERVAGVCGLQVPRPDSSPLARALVNGWPTASPERREQHADRRYGALPPAERRSLATFDNVSSCVRRSVLEEMPFERTVFGEDLRWGKRVIETGYKIVYEPRSAVLHSHERSALYDLRRHYVEGQVLIDLFGLTLTPNLALLLLNVLRSSADLYLRMSQGGKTSARAPYLALLAAKHAVSSQAGAYLAAKNRRLFDRWPHISARLDLFLRRGI